MRDYLASAPAPARRHLKAMRAAIRSAVPGAIEAFSYRMPAFRLEDRALVWYAAFRAHVSLFPITADIRRAFAAELTGLGTSTGTVRFPLAQPLPIPLVKRLVKARVAEVHAATSAKDRRLHRRR